MSNRDKARKKKSENALWLKRFFFLKELLAASLEISPKAVVLQPKAYFVNNFQTWRKDRRSWLQIPL